MNESTQPTVATPETTKAPAKSRKAKAPKKATKPVAATASNGKLRKPWQQVLRTLAKVNGGLSRRDIATRVGKSENLFNGRIANETLTYTTLCKEKLVREREVDIDGKKETVYEILAAGRKALAAK